MFFNQSLRKVKLITFLCLILLFIRYSSEGKTKGVIKYFHFGSGCKESSLFTKTFSLINRCNTESWDDEWTYKFLVQSETQTIEELQYNDKTCGRLVGDSSVKFGVCTNYTSVYGNFSSRLFYDTLELKKDVEYIHYLFGSRPKCNPDDLEIATILNLDECTYIGGDRRILGKCVENGKVELSYYYTEGCTGKPPHIEVSECSELGAYTVLYSCTDLT